MNMQNEKYILLLAEDDEDDRMMIQDALEEAGITVKLQCVNNGQELMDLLLADNQSAKAADPVSPTLILLDLNMPMMDGRKTLIELKRNTELKKIPVIIFTTSNSQEEVSWAYSHGASSFIIKPFSFDGMVNIMKLIKSYWLETVSLP